MSIPRDLGICLWLINFCIRTWSYIYYLHCIGHSGRFGHRGFGSCFVTYDECDNLYRIEKGLGNEIHHDHRRGQLHLRMLQRLHISGTSNGRKREGNSNVQVAQCTSVFASRIVFSIQTCPFRYSYVGFYRSWFFGVWRPWNSVQLCPRKVEDWDPWRVL
jgi:hypothetical protein